jgi:NDP-sugar pyrophosphorylase family protein
MFDFSKNLYPLLLKKKKPLYGAPIEGLWLDIGRPIDLIRANVAMIKKNGKRQKLAGKKTTSPVLIEPDAILDKTVKINGPCYIGQGVRVRGKSVIHNSAIYQNTVVDSAEIKDSLVMAGSEIGSMSSLETCILGERCVIGPKIKLTDRVLGDHEEMV